LQDVSLRDALPVLADELDLNVAMSNGADGRLSMHVEALSTEQAIAVLLFDTGPAFRLQGNLLVVRSAPLHPVIDGSRRLPEQLADELLTVYLPLSYADGRQLVELLGRSENSEAGAGLLSERGAVRVDVRTNTLIVRDSASHLAA